MYRVVLCNLEERRSIPSFLYFFEEIQLKLFSISLEVSITVNETMKQPENGFASK